MDHVISRAYSLAGIHASVLSIFLGVGGAYLLFLYQRVESARAKALRCAHRINDLRIPHLAGDIEKGLEIRKREGLKGTWRVLHPLTSSTAQPIDPDEIAEKGHKVFGLISAILCSYPYPNKLPGVEDGELVFKSTDDVRGWVRDVEDTTRQFRTILWSDREKLQYLANGVAGNLGVEDMKQRIVQQRETTHPAHFRDLMRTLDYNPQLYRQAPKKMAEWIGDAAQIAVEVRNRLRDVELYADRLPGMRFILAAAVVLGAVLITGVVLPLLVPTGWVVALATWVPVVVYLLSFCALVAFLVFRAPDIGEDG